ncbi:MAG: arylsulfatase, partial [Gemmatimonadaceae bacterium]|nr:arylsulfatase [Gemmatimonadaceae bacterium]
MFAVACAVLAVGVLEAQTPAAPPNIVLILVDNVGWGEFGVYGGGALRGAPTPRIDRFAAEGLRFLNFNVENDCVATRAALMTGRYAIRTGAMFSVPAGLPQGLIPWEITLPQLLSARGYATGLFGKWHLGDRPGRLPNDRGFDEWYGIPRTSNEALFTSTIEYDSTAVPIPYVMEGKKGEVARNVARFDLEMRRRIDAELVVRTNSFMRRQVRAGTPFFAFVPLTQLHFPTIPHRDFAGRTGHGDFADAMVELDFRVGEILDAIDALGIRDNTIVLFGSDNGPEFRRPWRGTAGPWQGTYHTAMEGGLRSPFMVRWPKRIAAGAVTDDIVHITDLYSTLAKIGGATVPTDRPIDGIDMTDFLLGRRAHSGREGFLFYIKTEFRAAKWRNYKMHVIWEPEPNIGPKVLETAWIFNLLTDPKEETDIAPSNGWVGGAFQRMIRGFQESLRANPPIPPGAPDDYVPK